MKSTLFSILILFGISIFITQCSPQKTIRQESQAPIPNNNQSLISFTDNDTLIYNLLFDDNNLKKQFISTFRNFLDQYPFASVVSSSKDKNIVTIKIAQDITNTPEEFTNSKQPEQIEKSKEQNISNETLNSSDTSTVIAKRGGKIRIYSERAFMDFAFKNFTKYYNPLTNASDNNKSSLYYGDTVSPRSIEIKLQGKLTDGNGQTLSALHFIDAWTKFTQTNPGEAYCIFKNIEGFRDFITKKEVVIKGFSAVNEKTIKIRFIDKDSLWSTRLQITKLVEPLNLGTYFIQSKKFPDILLKANQNTQMQIPYLDEISIRLGNDNNPLVSYSLNKYDAVVMSNTNDIEYAKRNLLKNASINHLSRDRYFLACAIADSSVRTYIRSILGNFETIKNFLKIEGKLISGITTDSVINQYILPTTTIPKPLIAEPIKLICRSDDPISKSICQKIYAEFNRNKIPCQMKNLDAREYELSLINNDFGYAIGWVNDNISADNAEKIRFFTLWCNNQTNEVDLINKQLIIPLFSVDHFLLLRNTFGIEENNLLSLHSIQY